MFAAQARTDNQTEEFLGYGTLVPEPDVRGEVLRVPGDGGEDVGRGRRRLALQPGIVDHQHGPRDEYPIRPVASRTSIPIPEQGQRRKTCRVEQARVGKLWSRFVYLQDVPVDEPDGLFRSHESGDRVLEPVGREDSLLPFCVCHGSVQRRWRSAASVTGKSRLDGPSPQARV